MSVVCKNTSILRPKKYYILRSQTTKNTRNAETLFVSDQFCWLLFNQFDITKIDKRIEKLTAYSTTNSTYKDL